jgi:hypothetical protein
MLGAELRRVRGAVLSSRWGLPAALLAWGALAGVMFSVWLAPPGAQPRPPSVRAAADSRPAEPSAEEAPAAAPTHAGSASQQDAAADAARVAAAVARWSAPPGPAAAHAYADARDERLGATLLSAGAPAAARPATAVLIRHRDGSAAGREAAKRIAEEARRAGVAVVGIRAAPAVPKGREVRHLQGGDAAEAERLAERFRGRWGSAWEVRTPGPGAPPASKAFAARPAPAHTLEVWLPHR